MKPDLVHHRLTLRCRLDIGSTLGYSSMHPAPGTYAIVYHSESGEAVPIGRWGELILCPGYYTYVGSAFGPGGVRARVMRHCRKEKRLHWHIDYLSQHVEPSVVWYSYDTMRTEHLWASALAGLPDARPINGFGCSDCQCKAHLFHTSNAPSLNTFSRIVGQEIERTDVSVLLFDIDRAK